MERSLLELIFTAKKREQDWRKLIAKVRQVYHGKLTYAANWYQEFEDVQFWDALDYIGIQGYFPLTNKEKPSVAELNQGWQPHLKAVEKISKKYKKLVLFTGVGYKSTADAAIEPWQWPDYPYRQTEKLDFQTQVNCYEALFHTFWDKHSGSPESICGSGTRTIAMLAADEALALRHKPDPPNRSWPSGMGGL